MGRDRNSSLQYGYLRFSQLNSSLHVSATRATERGDATSVEGRSSPPPALPFGRSTSFNDLHLQRRQRAVIGPRISLAQDCLAQRFWRREKCRDRGSRRNARACRSRFRCRGICICRSGERQKGRGRRGGRFLDLVFLHWRRPGRKRFESFCFRHGRDLPGYLNLARQGRRSCR